MSILELSKKLEHFENCKAIPLGFDRWAIVDAVDFEFLMQWQWSRSSLGYAYRRITINGTRKQVWMHRVLLGTPEGFFTDHINGDKCDNRKSNLRICDTSQNKQNGYSYAGSSSKYKGVSFKKDNGKWVARIRAKGKLRHLGYFPSEVEAAQAYNDAAPIYHGKFARLNHIREI